jgi:hypothetical protein
VYSVRSAPKVYRGQRRSFAGSRKLEDSVIDGLHLSSEVPREQQCGQKKNQKTVCDITRAVLH